MNNKKYIMSKISFLITFLGSLGLGINIILSELLYPNIDDFFDTPKWYQIFMYISLVIIVIGLILSIIFRNKGNINSKEIIIEIIIMGIGFVMMLFTLSGNETYVKDLIFVFGGALNGIGTILMISTLIGKSKKDYSSIKKFNNLLKLPLDKVWETNDKNKIVIAISYYIMNKCNFGENLKELSYEEQNIYITVEFNDEVLNGGFIKYLLTYDNSYLTSLLNALKEIEADTIIDIYKPILDKLPDYLPNQEDERDELLYSILDNKLEALANECDKKYYQVPYSYLEDLLYNYIVNNKEKIK